MTIKTTPTSPMRIVDGPRPLPRAVTAGLLGLAAGLLLYAYLVRRPQLHSGDFGYVWRAAGLLTRGLDPYTAMPPGPRYGIDGPFLYPVPAAVIAMPLTSVDVVTASAVFLGLSTALAAFGLTALGWWRLVTLFTPPFIFSLFAANWPPMMLAAATVPVLSWVVVGKPNLGLMVFAAWPRRATAIGVAALLVVSFLILPRWPVEWLSHLRAQTIPHDPPWRWGIGFVGLLGLLRWRTPEGRLLAAFTLLPVSAFPYDFLVLWLIPRTRRQMVILTACAWIVAPSVLGIDGSATSADTRVVRFLLVMGMLVPATIIVLRQPNCGSMPAWLERLGAYLPPWLRGTTGPQSASISA